MVREFRKTETGKHANRPDLIRALEYCKSQNCLLIIARLDRLGRNVAFISALMESSVEFIAVDNPHANRFMLHVMAAFAEHERELISVRTKQPLAAEKKRGVKLGALSHRKQGTNRKKADKFAKGILPLIRKLQSEHYTTVRAIADELNHRKVVTFHGGPKRWHKTTISNLLKRLHTLKLMPKGRKNILSNK